MVPHDEIVLFFYSSSGAVFRSSSIDLGKTWTSPFLLQVWRSHPVRQAPLV